MIERLLNRYWYGQKTAYSQYGPAFISYRHSDAYSVASELSWCLRSSGVPVWVDQTDLPPGEFKRRLREALSAGLSGGVIIVSREVDQSEIVRNVEVPGLLSLREVSAFSLVIANMVEAPSGSVDYEAPDRLLRQGRGLFSGIKHYPLRTEMDGFEIARILAVERAKAFARSPDSRLVLNLTTRTVPVPRLDGHHLAIRTEPPTAGRRRPPSSVWLRLRNSLGFLPDVIEVSACESVLVRGAAHLSVAFSVGATLPTTSPIPIEVEDRHGQVWQDGPVEIDGKLDIAAQALSGEEAIAAYVDLVPGLAPSKAYDDHLARNPERYVADLRIDWTSADEIPYESGVSIAKLVGNRIRDYAGESGVNRISLFMRTPFTAAFLLGRLFNTFTVELYEWENEGGDASYVPVLRVASGMGESPIMEILDTEGK